MIAIAKRVMRVNSTINVTPMVDVMVLLIIFMVITPMLQPRVSVDLAKVSIPQAMPDADKEDALMVAVNKQGKIFFGRDQLSGADQLTHLVKDRVASRTDKRVFIKADAAAKYGWVVDVVDNVRAAGVDQLGLLTEQRKTGSGAPPGAPSGQ